MRTKFHLHALNGVQAGEVKKSVLRPFLLMVAMETLKNTCVPSFTSMHCIVRKFEK